MQHLNRAQHAMQIERRSVNQWRIAQGGGVIIPSQTTPGVTYHVTLDNCNCPDQDYHPEVACKHQLAARLFFGRQSKVKEG